MNRVESTLEMKNITKYYGSNTALNDVSLSFEKKHPIWNIRTQRCG